MTKKVEIKQIRSRAGRVKAIYGTLDALGVGKIGQKATVVLNPATEGMIKKVRYLLEVKELN
jgi:ribosomal protein L30